MVSIAKSLVGAARLPGIAWSFSRIGYRRHSRHFDSADLDISVAGKQCAVTGGNSGIGFAIAQAWAKRHADVWLLCRNADRGQEAKKHLQTLGHGQVHLELLDVADPSSIDQFLDRVELPGLDVLVHNAGTLVHDYRQAWSGLELTFACHVVGPQRLTRGLGRALEAASDPRVIYVSSGGMYSEKLCVADLVNPPRPFDGVRAYALAKRAQVVLAEMWAARWAHTRFYAMHPGWVDTVGVERSLPGFYRVTKRWLRTAEEGADTAVWLSAVSALELPSGAFVFDRCAAPRHLLPGTRADDAERGRLWAEVDRLASTP